MNDAITELEFKLAFLEAAVETLNQAVTDQQQRIDLLERKLEAVQKHLKEINPSDIHAGEEKPPHY